MKILMVNHYATPPSQPGGTRHFSLAWALQARGHEVTLAASNFDHVTRSPRQASQPPVRREVLEGVPFLWLRTPPYRGNGPGRLWNMLVFARAVEKSLPRHLDGLPDVILGSSPHLFGAWSALRLARRLDRPFCLEIRDVWPQSLVDVMDIPRRHPLIWAMERVEGQLYRGADHIVTLLSGVGPRVAERGGDLRNLTWVPNGIDLGLVPPPGEGHGVPPGETHGRGPFTFMYAGSHGITNALEVVVDALAILKARGKGGLEVVLVGTGPEKERLRSLARERGLENLAFLPPVPKREIYGVLDRADAYLVSSRKSSLWNHGVSFNKLYDFMAMGRPSVVGLECPDNPMEASGSGLVVAPGDPEALALGMERLAAMDPEERRRMGERGRAYVRAHFDFRILAERLEGALLAAREAHRWRDHGG